MKPTPIEESCLMNFRRPIISEATLFSFSPTQKLYDMISDYQNHKLIFFDPRYA